MSPVGPDVFARATTRLVVLFTAIVVALVVVSGVVMYLTVRTNITGVVRDRSGERGVEVERELASQSISRLRWQLVAHSPSHHGIFFDAVKAGDADLAAAELASHYRKVAALLRRFLREAKETQLQR